MKKTGLPWQNLLHAWVIDLTNHELLFWYRVEYKNEDPKNPEQSLRTTIDTKPYTSIKLDLTSVEHDAGQATIPYLDIMEVTSKPPYPLVGVGLYHKKQPGYGGFLTLVLEGLNLGPYIDTDM